MQLKIDKKQLVIGRMQQGFIVRLWRGGRNEI